MLAQGITEPMTLITDYLLAGTSFYAFFLIKRSRNFNSLRSYWMTAFFALGFAALLGGTSHGFRLFITDFEKSIIWKLTLFNVFKASLALSLIFLMQVFSGQWMSRIKIILWLKFFIFLFLAVFVSDQFIIAILDYFPALLITGGVSLKLWLGRNKTYYRYFVLAVGLSFVGAIVQMLKVSLHLHFNHNDIYHIIQIVALWGFYTGARNQIEEKLNV
tara:strand:- start:48254 stop:48904 length:651 start_codon:yes stop_codon:yes gene_type:complete